MASLHNLLPTMSADELAWFDKCPKSVLFAIAQQLAMLASGDDNADTAFARMQEEWAALHANGLVPQKPFNPHGERRKRETRAQQQAQKAWAARRHWARMATAPHGRRDIFQKQYGMTPEEALAVPQPVFSVT